MSASTTLHEAPDKVSVKPSSSIALSLWLGEELEAVDWYRDCSARRFARIRG